MTIMVSGIQSFIGRTVLVCGAAVLFSAGALAAPINLSVDFTKSTQTGAGGTGSVALKGSSTPQTFSVSGLDFGVLDIEARWTPAHLASNADGVGGLPPEFAGQIDGFGIGDDEITGGSSNQSLTLNFSRAVWVDNIFALDVFKSPDGGNGERVTVELANSITGDSGFFNFGFNGSTLFGNFNGTVGGNALSIDFLNDSVAATGVNLLNQNRGLVELSTQPADHLFRIFQATSLTFTAQGSSANDYALAGLSLADVTAVPVPAALPLLGTALGLMGFLARRRKRLTA